ncbi:MAG: phosphoribosylanthranilate isomerase [Acidobacteriota bacterium]
MTSSDPKSNATMAPPHRRRIQRRRVKICGVTTPEDAVLAADLGADLLGLNFYKQSPRYVDEGRARELVAAVGPRVTWAGVFVNLPVAEAEGIADRVGLDVIQLHGDESPEDAAALGPRALPVLRVRDTLDRSAIDRALATDPWGLLLDTHHPRLYGGTGHGWDFGSLRQLAGTGGPLHGRRVLVAGGLRPGNARAAADASDAWGIDLCSGVEARPGIKDPRLMRDLFEEIHHAESSAV